MSQLFIGWGIVVGFASLCLLFVYAAATSDDEKVYAAKQQREASFTLKCGLAGFSPQQCYFLRHGDQHE